MALRVRVKRRDVVRIGDALVAVDGQTNQLCLIIDAPRSSKISVVKNEGGMTIGELMVEINTGKRPTTDGARGGEGDT